MSDIPENNKSFALEDGTEIDYSVGKTGSYLFSIKRYKDNTIDNFARAAMELSIKDSKPIKFIFSGQYVTIDMSVNPPVIEAPDDFIADTIRRIVHGRSEYEIDESKKALQSWILGHKSAINDLAKEILVDELGFVPFNNVLESPNFATAVYDITANFGYYNQTEVTEDPFYSKLVKKSYKLRTLASELETDDSIIGIFNDYQDAVDYLIMVIIRLIQKLKS